MKLSELKRLTTVALKPFISPEVNIRAERSSSTAISKLFDLHPTVSTLTVSHKGFTITCKTPIFVSVETLSAEDFAESIYNLLQEKNNV